ncbi:hypothetical protein AB0B89_36595 [Sphaerisporangium sp. NPDC049002]
MAAAAASSKTTRAILCIIAIGALAIVGSILLLSAYLILGGLTRMTLN